MSTAAEQSRHKTGPRLLWQIGGANADLLPQCPSHERAKFVLLGVINSTLALVIAYITAVAFWYYLELVFLDPVLDSPGVAKTAETAASPPELTSPVETAISTAAPLFAGLFGFLLALPLLVSAVRLSNDFRIKVIHAHAERTRNRMWIGSMRDKGLRLNSFIVSLLPSTVIVLWLTTTSSFLVSALSGRRLLPLYELASTAGVSIGLALVPLVILWSWRTPVYDSLLSLQAPTADAERPDVTIKSEDKAAIDRPALLRDLQKYREVVLNDPKNIDARQKLAEALDKLDRRSEYAEAVNEIERLRGEAAFGENLEHLNTITVAGFEALNLDFFGSFQWKFSPRMNVLLGRNGYGKSHLFTLLVALLQNEKTGTEGAINSASQSDAEAVIGITRDDEQHTFRFTPLGFEGNTVGKIPLLAISELRFIDKSKSGFGKEEVGDKSDLAVHGAYHFLHNLPLGPIIQNFLHRLCQESSEKQTRDLPIIRLFYDVVRRLTSTDFRIHEIKRHPTSSDYSIKVITDGNDTPVKLQMASQGTLSVMALVALIFDFLRSVFAELPEDELTQQRAIVFIDELDAHMHPSWQRKILGILRDTFPMSQFFVAAHSPLVVAGCKEGEVSVLRRNDEGKGFRLKQFDRHFMGATTTELYNSIFEIEEKDETYLKYAAMYPYRSDIEEEAKKLEAQITMSPKEKAEFDKLVDTRRTKEHKKRLVTSLLEKEKPRREETDMLTDLLKEVGADLSTVENSSLEKSFSLTADEQIRLAELEKRQRLPPEKAARLDRLYDDLYYLSEFERIEAERKRQRLQERAALLDIQDGLGKSSKETSTDAE